MKGGIAYVVTPRDGGPYRVTLVPEGDGWSAVVERGDERWSFALSPGQEEGRVLAGDRPLRWRHDRAAGRLILGGDPHELSVESAVAHRGQRDAAAPAAARARDVRAPMPGLVVALLAGEGDAVSAGQGVVVVEAMKMENQIGAPSAGVVTKLSVQPGDTVEKDTFLFRVEPAP